MSQEQPLTPQQQQQQQPVKYGHVFDVSRELSTQPITPNDASAMQAAKNMLLGNTPKDSPATVMQSAAAVNLQHGFVGPDSFTPVATDQGITASEAQVGGSSIITEAVGEQVVGQNVEPGKSEIANPAGVVTSNPMTVGEALETAALSAGNKPIDHSDAAAIQAAEVRASGSIHAAGVAVAARSAADINAGMENLENKTRLGDILADAGNMLEKDRPVTTEIAEGVTQAEIRNNPDLVTYPGGIAASMTAAAKLNQDPTF